ncbi:hypothetical protein [cf. Phormidesmis sp. LEGE 11477]|uniref:hypothetical protein n=1 Tax=cf. Phormidesmis sp. LEGE 11477 TaxID=1828680 RepID=UPI001881335D|nr:hypothetical protein [cf. Phormidesmis sp. LEGE 11477]
MDIEGARLAMSLAESGRKKPRIINLPVISLIAGLMISALPVLLIWGAFSISPLQQPISFTMPITSAWLIGGILLSWYIYGASMALLLPPSPQGSRLTKKALVEMALVALVLIFVSALGLSLSL